MATVMTDPGSQVFEGTSERSQRSSVHGDVVHIWSGGGHVLCKTQRPLVVVRFDCVSLFSRDSLCPRCVAAFD
jgi:hypothetical protein